MKNVKQLKGVIYGFKYGRYPFIHNTKGSCSLLQLWWRIKYYDYLCWICGKDYEEIDHVIPVSKGGTNWPANLRPICKKCNRVRKYKGKRANEGWRKVK